MIHLAKVTRLRMGGDETRQQHGESLIHASSQPTWLGPKAGVPDEETVLLQLWRHAMHPPMKSRRKRDHCGSEIFASNTIRL